jgi:hypothetical protein
MESKKSKGEIIEEIMNKQLNAFAEKYGREPGPQDSIFFELDDQIPISYSRDRLRDRLLQVAIKSGVDPACVLLKFDLPTPEGKA